jgi:hypothetical protein
LQFRKRARATTGINIVAAIIDGISPLSCIGGIAPSKNTGRWNFVRRGPRRNATAKQKKARHCRAFFDEYLFRSVYFASFAI